MVVKVIDSVQTGKLIEAKCKAAEIKPTVLRKYLQLESVQSIYKWYSDRTTCLPSLDHMVMLASILGCRVDDLLATKEMEVS